MSDKKKGPIKNRDKNKSEQGTSRNLSNRMYGYEEGDEKPSAAGKSGSVNEAANTATREGAVEKNTRKKGISYEPDNDISGAQGAHGQGNAISRGTEGRQGYGESDPDHYNDQDYDGQFENKEED